jgi:DNA-binding transcriptional ArsR family regulator
MKNEAGHERRIESLREQVATSSARVAILAALGGGRELSAPDLSAQLPDDVSLGTVNYHLSVLQEARTVSCVGGLYRLAEAVP